MAADLLKLSETTMYSYSPFILANAPPIDPGFGVSPIGAFDQPAAIEVSDYFAYDEGPLEDSSLPTAELRPNGLTTSVMECGVETKRMKVDVGCRIGFRTESEVEILDDGFKWRKYGKKSVKNSPNPRNYYRCSREGCGVKKRVERDREDPRYVITTYEGVHNHSSPGAVCYSFSPQQADASGLVSFWQRMPLNPWTLQSAPFSY